MYATPHNTNYVHLTGECLEGMSNSQLKLILDKCSVAKPSGVLKIEEGGRSLDGVTVDTSSKDNQLLKKNAHWITHDIESCCCPESKENWRVDIENAKLKLETIIKHKSDELKNLKKQLQALEQI